MDRKVLVVIPYLAREAQGRELELAVAGWRQHFKEDYVIAVVGDYHPVVDTGKDIVFINSPRVGEVGEGNYRAHVDFTHKFRAAHAAFPNTEGFIFTCDDIYAVNDFTLADVKELKYVPGGVDFDPQSPNTWRRDKMKTKALLTSLGYPCRDFTLHLPIWLDWDKAEAMWDRFGMDHESYVHEDLYFNLYYPVAGAIPLEDGDSIKCTINNTRPDLERIRRAFTEKVWINNSPTGYIPALEQMLIEHYNKSFLAL